MKFIAIVTVSVFIASACAALTNPGRITLVGIPKTGSSYLHLNMQYMLEEFFGYDGGNWPKDIHHRRLTSPETGSTLAFDHTCLWHIAPARSANIVRHHYKRRFASSDKVVVLVRDEVQVLQSAYDYFNWESTRIAKGYDDERWHSFVLDQYSAVQACYKPFRDMMLNDATMDSKILLVHFDEMVADCDGVMDRIAHFLFGRSSAGYRCHGKEDSNRSRIPADRSQRSVYADPDGGLERLHAEARISWSKLLDRQQKRINKAF